jgi:hypothetical protein
MTGTADVWVWVWRLHGRGFTRVVVLHTAALDGRWWPWQQSVVLQPLGR